MSKITSTMLEVAKWKTCKGCNNDITWDEGMRALLGTTRPIDTNGEIHECTAYQKPAGGTTTTTPQYKPSYPPKKPSQSQQQQAYISNEESMSNILNSDELSISLKQTLAALVTQQNDQLEKINQAISRMHEDQTRIIHTLHDFMTYNPTERSLNNLITTLLDYIPKPALTKPVRADELHTDNINPLPTTDTGKNTQ